MKNKLIILIMALPLILTFVVFSVTSFASIKTNVAVAGVEIENEDYVSLNLAESDVLKIKTKIFPSGATNKQVNYECEKVNPSDNVSWKIFDDGLLSFFGYGQVRVKVSTVDGNYKDSIIVFVTSSKLIDFSILAPGSSVNIGDTINFETKQFPANISYDSIEWQTSNSHILAIDGMGRAKANSAGNVTVTAVMTSDGKSITKSVNIIVNQMNINNIALINGNENATAKTIKSSYEFNAVVNLTAFEGEVSTKDFAFEIDDSVKNLDYTHTFQSNQLIFTGSVVFDEEFVGTAEIKLKYLETQIAMLSVQKAEYLSKQDCDFYLLNDYVRLGSRGYYSISHLEDDRVYFDVVSSNKDILQLSQSGSSMMYNAKSSGSVVVTAYCYYGSEIKFSFSKTINVVKVYSSLSFTENTKDYYINKIDNLVVGNEKVANDGFESDYYIPQVKAEGSFAASELITLYSSDESVARFEDGKLSILSEGVVTITAVNKYGAQTGDETYANLTINCVMGVNVYTYEDLVVATESGKQVVVQNDIMLGRKVLTRDENGTTLTSDAAQVLASEVKYIDTTADWTFYKNNNQEKPQVAYCIEFKNNVYGNGYTLSGEYITNIIDNTNKPYGCAIFKGPLDLVSLQNIASVKSQDNIVFLVRNSSITISNIELKGCDGEDIDDLNKLNYIGTVLEVMGDNVNVVGCNILNGRNCVRVYGDYYDNNKVINVTFDRCVIRYAREFLVKMGTNKHIEGDISSSSSLAEKYENASPNLGNYNYLENNVANESFRNEFVKTYVNLADSMLATSGVFAIGIECKFAGPCLDGEKYNEWDFTEFGWLNIVGTSYASVLNLVGDVRIYDWKKLDDVDSSTLIEVAGNDSYGLALDMSSIINGASKIAQYSLLVSQYNNESYVHGGIVLYGGGKNYSAVVKTDYVGGALNEYTIGFEVLENKAQQNILELAAGNKPFRFMLYDENGFSIDRQVYDFSTGEAFTYLVK